MMMMTMVASQIEIDARKKSAETTDRDLVEQIFLARFTRTQFLLPRRAELVQFILQDLFHLSRLGGSAVFVVVIGRQDHQLLLEPAPDRRLFHPSLRSVYEPVPVRSQGREILERGTEGTSRFLRFGGRR